MTTGAPPDKERSAAAREERADTREAQADARETDADARDIIAANDLRDVEQLHRELEERAVVADLRLAEANVALQPHKRPPPSTRRRTQSA